MYLFCVGVFTSMYVHVCVCMCVRESLGVTLPCSLLIVGLCVSGEMVHMTRQGGGCHGLHCVLTRGFLCIYKCNVFPFALFVNQKLKVQFQVCYVTLMCGEVELGDMSIYGEMIEICLPAQILLPRLYRGSYPFNISTSGSLN